MSSEVKLAVNLGGLEMKNPVTCASGTFGIGQEYGDFVAVNDLSLQIKKNSFTGLLGPNGAGKSTSLKIRG